MSVVLSAWPMQHSGWTTAVFFENPSGGFIFRQGSLFYLVQTLGKAPCHNYNTFILYIILSGYALTLGPLSRRSTHQLVQQVTCFCCCCDVCTCHACCHCHRGSHSRCADVCCDAAPCSCQTSSAGRFQAGHCAGHSHRVHGTSKEGQHAAQFHVQNQEA